MIKDILISARPQAWTKNLVLFIGLIFSRNFFNPYKFYIVCAAVLVFCLASSAIYLINDILDIEFDRKHPKKSRRPIALGRLEIPLAQTIAILLLVWALAMSFILNGNFFLLLSAYVVIQIFYSIFLKNIVIVDVFCIASGFLLRVLSGAAVIDAPVSNWLLICTIFLSLFLALAKRRSELVLMEEGARHHRCVLSEYSLTFIDQMVTVVAASAVLSYVLYAFSAETVSKFHARHLEYTIPFVVYGIFRYLYLVYHKKEGASPEKLLFSDKPLFADLVLYVAAVLAIIYF